MSANYAVKGYVDIRIRIDNTYQASGSASPKDIADLVCDTVSINIGSCEVLNHLLQMREFN